MYTLKREQWIPAGLEETFRFFAEAGNLEAITPPWLGFRILTPQPIAISAGAEIRYSLRWHGIPLRWKTEITQWNPPYAFEDFQRSGPYRLWHHRHTFVPVDGGTLMTDIVDYDLYLGPVGTAIHWLAVKANVEKIFDYRYQRVRELFSPTVAV